MYKIICKKCKRWIWTTEKSSEFLGNIDLKEVPQYLCGSPEFKKPKETDRIVCPNCGIYLFPMSILKFEVLVENKK